jgi:Ca2+-binding RTX toxin-like protein
MHPLRSRAALFAAASTIGALAIPAAAHATVTPTFDPGTKTLTVSGDQANDTITVAVNAAGNYTVNGTEVAGPVAAANDITVVVDGGAGRDVIDTSALTAAQYKEGTLKGGDGDDVISGGAQVDHVFGDNGNDRVAGGKNPANTVEDHHGGAGNDTLVWNNGEGTDSDEGDAGSDDVEVNGSTTGNDEFEFAPGATAGHVQFNRVALNGSTTGNFGLDISTTEHLTVNGLGGDDRIQGAAGIAPLLTFATELNGGEGVDTITGSDANDFINGGEDNDVLNGAGGDDIIRGDHGNDTMNGGDGDDTLIWANGDGSDVTNGDAGLDTTQVDNGGANDVMTVAPNGNRTRFDRSNAPFSMDMDTEVLAINSFAGNDSLSVAPGVGGKLSIVADAGSGNDAFTGGDEVDTFLGGLGDDRLEGGTGADLLDGQDGNDALFARDGLAHGVRGGAGTDSAQVDAIDAVDGVEAVDAPPAAAAARILSAKVTTSKVTLVRKNGRLIAKLKVACPAGAPGGCTSTVQLATKGTVKIGGAKLVALLGSQKVSLKAGQTKTVQFKLAGGIAKLAKKGKLATVASIMTKDAAGNVATSARSVSLALPRRK